MDIISGIVKAKEKNLSFFVFRNFYKNAPSRESFLKYIEDKNITKPNVEILKNDFVYFDNWSNFSQKLSDLYSTDGHSSMLYTHPIDIEIGGAELHNDYADVIHVNCYGNVEWKIIDRCNNEHIVRLNPGDVLYLKQGTFHQTKVLSGRGSLIYMPYKLVD